MHISNYTIIIKGFNQVIKIISNFYLIHGTNLTLMLPSKFEDLKIGSFVTSCVMSLVSIAHSKCVKYVFSKTKIFVFSLSQDVIRSIQK